LNTGVFLSGRLAAAFDLLPMNFGVDADVNRNQGEVNEDRDWNRAIKPCASQISSHLTRGVLHMKLGFSQLRSRFVGLDREDELANASIYKIRYEGNAITPNEYRARLGEAPAEQEWRDMTFADVQMRSMRRVEPARSTTRVCRRARRQRRTSEKMPLSIHDIDLADGSTPTMQDRLIGGLQLAVTNAAGATGATVTTAVSFGYGLLANYSVFVDAGQECFAWVSGKTSTGFNVNLAPTTTSGTVAAGCRAQNGRPQALRSTIARLGPPPTGCD
jgi:hypothetical protein